MSKRIIAMISCLALVLVPLPAYITVSVEAAAAVSPVSVTFSDNNISALTAAEITVEVTENATGAIVKGEQDHDGDGASIKLTHNEGANYTSIYNAVRVTFGTPLPANTIYNISGWFYVPEQGNTEGKAGILGPGILINSRSDNDEYKHPTSAAEAGKTEYDQWTQVSFETPAYEDEMNYVEFRFYTNDASSHPEVWYIDDLKIIPGETIEVENLTIEDLPSLKDAYKDYFLFGTAAGSHDLSGTRMDLINKHFDTLTFGNEMKPDSMQRIEGDFTFDTADTMIDTLQENKLNIIGHVLLWHSQSPDWMWSDKDKAKARLEKHIEEVLTRYGKDLVAIDVVNEAFNNSTGTGEWRDELRKTEGWYTALGSDFIEIAFRKADEVRKAIGRPDLKLYYNDFNLDELNKSQKVYEMVTELRNKGVPIDGIGMQSHFNQDTSAKNVKRSLELFNSIPGIEVSCTELDVTIQSSLGNSSLTEDEDKRQASVYAQLFSVYKEYAAGSANPDESKRLIERVTIWGTTDNISWRSDRNPILFNRYYQAKGAFYAVLDPEGYMAENGIQSPVSEYTPPKAFAAKGTPTIDGELDEIWNATEEISVNMPVSNDPLNATAKARVLWDNDYLYVYAEVTDPILDETSRDNYQQDSIEVFVSETNHKNESYAQGDGQYRVSLSNKQSFNAKKSDGFESAAKITDSGYIIELKIKLYAATPADGYVIGFDLQVNDATDGTRTARAIWSDLAGQGYQSAATWGDVTLVNELPKVELSPTPAPDPSPAADNPATATETETSSDGSAPVIATWLIIVIILAAVAAAVVVIVFVVLKSRKKNR